MTVRNRPRTVLVVTAAVVIVVLVSALIYRAVRNSGSAAPVALDRVDIDGDVGVVPAAGAWTIDGGVVGYRVFEPLDVTVTGRSTAVTGQFRIDTNGDTQLIDATVTADLAQLRSDATGRDQALRTRILETDRYPTARFALSSPVAIGVLPPGVPVAVSAPGTLTVREQDQPQVAQLQVRWDGSEIRVVGTIEISLAGYGVEVPSAGGVSTIEDGAVIEFDVTGRGPGGQ